MNWSEFFHMGGYALYVWSSYALAGVILVLNLVIARRRRRTVLQSLREFHRLKGRSS